MLIHFVAVYLALLPFAQCIQIHKYMTKREVWKTFQTGHDNVPDYQIVRLYHTLHKRDMNDNSARTVKYNAFGRTLSLYLEPTEGILAGVSTPVWTVEEDAGQPGKLKHTLQPNLLANIGRAYQDVSQMAAVVAYEGKDGETLVHGNLPDDSVIRPLPHHLHNTVLRESRDLEDFLPDGVDGEADFRRSHHHVVFKRREADMNANHDGINFYTIQNCLQFPLTSLKLIRSTHYLQGLPSISTSEWAVKRERRSSGATVNDISEISITDIVYPEILIIVDSIIYEVIGKKLEDVARYVLAFWNGVDLRYRLLENPIIRLNIAGIIISLEPHGTPFLQSDPNTSNLTHMTMAFQNMSSYLFAESHRFPFATYDIAIAMTGLKLYGKARNGTKTRLHGVALFRGACNRDHTRMITTALGIIYDNGGYKGIITAAHELAHSLGAYHDDKPRYTDCPATDEYIMSNNRHLLPNNFQFSKCSLKDLYDFLSSPESTCLRNKPRADQALPRLLPGQLMTLDEQCEKINGTKACFHDARVCSTLGCISKNGTDCTKLSAAAEGSPCGNELYCINGYCVSKTMAHVPYEPSTTADPSSTTVSKDPATPRPGAIQPCD